MPKGAEAEERGAPNLSLLCHACLCLNKQRVHLDRRIAALHLQDDEGDDTLWQALEDVLVELGDAAERLASISATQFTELRAKAEVLAMLMRIDDASGDPVLPRHRTSALAISLADDLVGLPGDSAGARNRWTNWLPSAVRRARWARH
jgi:hypothetical protein